MKKLSEGLYQKITKKVLIITIIVFVLFVLIVMPIVSNYTAKVTNDAESPDLSFVYNADDLYKMAQDFGEQGREAYITLRFTFDLVFPILYVFFLMATS